MPAGEAHTAVRDLDRALRCRRRLIFGTTAITHHTMMADRRTMTDGYCLWLPVMAKTILDRAC